MGMTGGDLLLDLLENQGVEYIFSSPGTEWAPVWEGLLKRDASGNHTLKYVNCRHETLAVSMAQGYAETSGRMAAVLLHSGVGVLNGSMAIRNAYFAKAPMLIISGETYEHSGDGNIKPQGWHWLGLLSDIGGPTSMVKSYVKWTNTVKSRESLIDLVDRGCRIAQSPSPGPVFLTISPELLSRSFPEQKVKRTYPAKIRIEVPSAGLEEAAKLLIASRRPLILTEYAGKNPAAVKALVKLAEILSIPVFEFLPFFGNFPKNHPLYMGYNSTQALQEADTVFVVGSTLPWYPPSACLRDTVKIILLDEDSLHPHIPQWGYHIDISLTSDIERGLESLIQIIQNKLSQQKSLDPLYEERLFLWQPRHEKVLQDWQNEALAEKNNLPISSRWFLHKVREIMPVNSLFVDETILHTRTVHQFLGNPDSFIRSTYGGLGVGFGEAIGVKIARPDRTVALIIGDGAFNYNPSLAGLGLCQEYQLPLLVMVVNNGGYIAMKQGHKGLFPQGVAATSQKYLGVDISPAPDYVKIAEAFGAYGEKLENPADIDSALKRCLQEITRGRTALLDVVTV